MLSRVPSYNGPTTLFPVVYNGISHESHSFSVLFKTLLWLTYSHFTSLTFFGRQITQFWKGFHFLSTSNQRQSVRSDSESVQIFHIIWHRLNFVCQEVYGTILGINNGLQCKRCNHAKIIIIKKKKTEKEYAAFNVQLVLSDAYVAWDSRPYINLYYHFFQL